MTLIWVRFLFKLDGGCREVTGLTHITQTHVAFWRRENEGIWSAGVKLDVSYDLLDVVGVARIKINQVVGGQVTFNVPQVNILVVRWNEVLTVGTHAQCVYIVLVAVLVTFFQIRLDLSADDLWFWHDDLISLQRCFGSLTRTLIIYLPKFDYPFISRNKFNASRPSTRHESKWIDSFANLCAFQVVKDGLVWLKFWEIAIVEVPWRLEVSMTKDYHTTTLITHC